MYHFFTDRSRIRDGMVHITGNDVNHIRNVLRMKKGELIVVSCGDEWEYTCRIFSLSGESPSGRERNDDREDEILAEIVDAQKPGKELPSKIYLFQCLPKSDKMELIIQKAVELGVYRVIPVSSGRTIVRLDKKKAEKKTARWNAIAESAAKQSGRMIIPAVLPVMRFRDALSYAEQEQIDVRFIPYEMAEDMNVTRRLFSEIGRGKSIAIMIGPEGGFEEAEVEEARGKGFTSISLGKRILRTETAGMTVLSILMYLLNE